MLVRRGILQGIGAAMVAPHWARAQAPGAGGTTVALDGGGHILVNGRVTTLFGFRVGSAALRDNWTEALIAQLDLWRAHGVNALILWLQGTSGGYTRLFTDDGKGLLSGPQPILARTNFAITDTLTPNGTTTPAAVLARTRRIIAEADRRGMLVIGGMFYRNALLDSDTPAILAEAAATAAREIGQHPNLMLNVFNEAQTNRPLESVDSLRGYIRAAKAASPGTLVGAGSLRAAMTPAIADIPELDIVMQDAGRTGPETIAVFDDLRRRTPKAIINVESFEGFGSGTLDDLTKTLRPPPGYTVDFRQFRRVFGAWVDADTTNPILNRATAGRLSYLSLIDHVGRDAERRTHLMVHVAGWFQGASRVEGPEQLGEPGQPGRWNNAFHVGHGLADGTVENPGIRWILERMRAHR